MNIFTLLYLNLNLKRTQNDTWSPILLVECNLYIFGGKSELVNRGKSRTGISVDKTPALIIEIEKKRTFMLECFLCDMKIRSVLCALVVLFGLVHQSWCVATYLLFYMLSVHHCYNYSHFNSFNKYLLYSCLLVKPL